MSTASPDPRILDEAKPALPAPAPQATRLVIRVLADAARSLRAVAKSAIFLLKVFPMLPSRSVDWVTAPPLVERVEYPTRDGLAEGDLYRPATGGPHPGILVCLGVVPFDVEHPQVARLGAALARAGFAALLHWSPAMRDLRFDPDDVANLALAYRWLIERPDIDPARSGFVGTCVGGAFGLMAAADPHIRDRVAFVTAYAPYASMWTLARDITSATRPCGETREPWAVDPLTRTVYVRSLTDHLVASEAALLRNACAERGGQVDPTTLSAAGRAVYPLLDALDADAAEAALRRLPPAVQERLTAMSPLAYLADVHAPLLVFLHDRGDAVIPVGESRQLRSALTGRAGVRYTELGFQHLSPYGMAPFRLVRELGKFYRAIYPVFRCAATRGGLAAAPR
jgi:dienelactone hydrolase